MTEHHGVLLPRVWLNIFGHWRSLQQPLGLPSCYEGNTKGRECELKGDNKQRRAKREASCPQQALSTAVCSACGALVLSAFTRLLQTGWGEPAHAGFRIAHPYSCTQTCGLSLGIFTKKLVLHSSVAATVPQPPLSVTSTIPRLPQQCGLLRCEASALAMSSIMACC